MRATTAESRDLAPGRERGDRVAAEFDQFVVARDTASITVLGDVPDDARLLIVHFEQVG